MQSRVASAGMVGLAGWRTCHLSMLVDLTMAVAAMCPAET